MASGHERQRPARDVGRACRRRPRSRARPRGPRRGAPPARGGRVGSSPARTWRRPGRRVQAAAPRTEPEDDGHRLLLGEHERRKPKAGAQPVAAADPRARPRPGSPAPGASRHSAGRSGGRRRGARRSPRPSSAGATAGARAGRGTFAVAATVGKSTTDSGREAPCTPASVADDGDREPTPRRRARRRPLRRGARRSRGPARPVARRARRGARRDPRLGRPASSSRRRSP